MFKGLTFRRGVKAAAAVFAAVFCFTANADAEYNRVADSAIDLDIFKIKEKDFLGVKLDRDYKLVDRNGEVLSFGDLRGKPFILVLSYYKCDGVCSAVNADLKELLKGVERNEIGKDFEVVTASFDKYDNRETLAMFEKELALPGKMEKGWTLTVAEDPEAITKFTDSLGFKYFWSPRDKTFFHPNVYIVVSPEGRVSRYLYANTITAKDIDISLLEANAEKVRPSQVIDLVVGYCYSYNYKEGKYTLNIPLFVAVGSLTIGVTAFVVSAVVFKKSNDGNA